MKNLTRPVLLDDNDRALLLALLERELEIGPLNQGKPEKEYISRVIRLRIALGRK